MIEPLPLLSHRFAEDLNWQDCASEIEADDALERGARDIEEGKTAEYSSVRPVAAGGVDQDVHSAPVVEQFLPGGLQAVFVQDIGWQGDSLVAGGGDFVGHVAGLLLPPPQYSNARAGSGQSAGHGSTQDTGTAGDDGNFAFQ